MAEFQSRDQARLQTILTVLAANTEPLSINFDKLADKLGQVDANSARIKFKAAIEKSGVFVFGDDGMIRFASVEAQNAARRSAVKRKAPSSSGGTTPKRSKVVEEQKESEASESTEKGSGKDKEGAENPAGDDNEDDGLSVNEEETSSANDLSSDSSMLGTFCIVS